MDFSSEIEAGKSQSKKKERNEKKKKPNQSPYKWNNNRKIILNE